MKHQFLFILFFHHIMIHSQTIENVDFHAEGQTIVVTYDLIGCVSNDHYSVGLEFVSETGEKVIPKTVSGDLTNLACGTKRIVWEVFKDRSSFEGKYKVQVSVLPATKTVKDIDGNIYNTVQIGNQLWFAENLRTSKYNDGVSIPNVSESNAWSTLSTGAYCFYDNKPENNAIYGNLYNWYAVDTKKLCPVGWHVPSDEEWTVLSDYLGGLGNAGQKMKTTSGWNINGNGADCCVGTNSSGFSGLPGGFRGRNGTFIVIGIYGNWWSSEEDHANVTWVAWYRLLYYNSSTIGRDREDKKGGRSVRCLGD
jgi:uncharacterized protein (TIGR02145 family)